MTRTRTICFKVSEEEAEAIEKLAKRIGVSRGKMIRCILLAVAAAAPAAIEGGCESEKKSRGPVIVKLDS